MQFDITKFLLGFAIARSAGADAPGAGRAALAATLAPFGGLTQSAVLAHSIASSTVPPAQAVAAPAPARAGREESPDLVAVPDLRNVRQRGTIERRIHDKELRAEITTVPTPDPNRRGVLLQCPRRGARVPRGEMVHVVLGTRAGGEEGGIGEEMRENEAAEGMDRPEVM